ncbi:acyl carrier protein [Catellatospora sp. TT07R-123]|uniref:acyl carrier protein n=1 Tax=Catellatospora sp. TT07R-123 TaxID=2733863 RepID=UPI001BB456BC|nr:acyl carrier protein [Catellatospora sp. TT07R-123]
MAADLRGFVTSAARERAPADDDDIFALGYLTSLRALELVTYVERRFGLTVDAEDLSLDNFRTIARIAAFVGRKTAAEAIDADTGPQ